MTTPQKKIALISGQGEGKTPHAHFNSAEAQRQRLMDWLRVHRMIDTLAARRDLDILAPAARVHELRHRYGHRIDLVWVKRSTDSGKFHRVALYVLQREACHD